MTALPFPVPAGHVGHRVIVEVSNRTGRGAPRHLGVWEIRITLPVEAEAEIDVLDWAPWFLRMERRLDDSVDFTYLARPYQPGDEINLRGTIDKVLEIQRGRGALSPEASS